jgi:hypothetical protein
MRMKRVVRICVLLLALFGTYKLVRLAKDHVTGHGGSSPIIIADGSVKINQKDLVRIHGSTRASIRLIGYTPKTLGYQCDLRTAGDCSAGSCNKASITPKCTIDLTIGAWSLALYTNNLFSNAVATLSGQDGAEEVSIDLPYGFISVGDGTIDGSKWGVDLVASSDQLQAAQFNGSSTYQFTCKAKQKCFTIQYDCPPGGGCDAN